MSSFDAFVLRHPMVLTGILQAAFLLFSVATHFHGWREVTAFLAMFIPRVPRHLIAIGLLAITTSHLHFHRNQGSMIQAAVAIISKGGHLNLPPTPALLENVRPFVSQLTSRGDEDLLCDLVDPRRHLAGDQIDSSVVYLDIGFGSVPESCHEGDDQQDDSKRKDSRD